MPSGSEWFIVLAVVLVIFGGSQLPKLAKNLGKAQKEFKDGLAEGQAETAAKPEHRSGGPPHRDSHRLVTSRPAAPHRRSPSCRVSPRSPSGAGA